MTTDQSHGLWSLLAPILWHLLWHRGSRGPGRHYMSDLWIRKLRVCGIYPKPGNSPETLGWGHGTQTSPPESWLGPPCPLSVEHRAVLPQQRKPLRWGKLEKVGPNGSCKLPRPSLPPLPTLPFPEELAPLKGELRRDQPRNWAPMLWKGRKGT